MNETGGPTAPFKSRSRTVTLVSPTAKPNGGAIGAQNWMLLIILATKL